MKKLGKGCFGSLGMNYRYFLFFYIFLFARELNTYTADPESTKIAPV
jgi:hypothetical protein